MFGDSHSQIFKWAKKESKVNCLEQHPTMPVLATSGLDDDIKIWVPSCEDPPDLKNLRSHMIRNMKEREADQRNNDSDAFVDQTIWFLMQHLTRNRRRPEGLSEIDDSDSTSSSEDDMEVSPPPCSQS
ncbi:DDB1- and CUL4-associated factor 8 [Trichonephila clavata]|uniref:DDB1- and CUL4-associated factor 8 n=1 Tax=Trichonephila clavata TaxID=2740835 RepID=A0A8X6FJ32_TRICU|nr:DDB1- and CUL4-associated factor 8 [Trichonephila clavata]